MTLLSPAQLGLALAPRVVRAGFHTESPERVLVALHGFSAEGLGENAVPKRRAEFLAGRWACEHALAALGFGEPAISARVAKHADRSPIWPPGVVGSITHGAGLAVAAVAWSSDYSSLGIDVEWLLGSEQAREVAASIGDDAEYELLAAARPELDAASRVTLLFSAKESAYKCLYPWLGEFLEFAHLKLQSAGSVLALALEREGLALARGHLLHADYWLGEGRVETAAYLRAPSHTDPA